VRRGRPIAGELSALLAIRLVAGRAVGRIPEVLPILLLDDVALRIENERDKSYFIYACIKKIRTGTTMPIRQLTATHLTLWDLAKIAVGIVIRITGMLNKKKV
jgi:hypothetical protein